MAKVTKTPEWKRLINRCQKLWEAYDRKPTKAGLEKFGAHIEKMKDSKSARVATERSRAARAFRTQWKAQGYKAAAKKKAPRKRRKKNPYRGSSFDFNEFYPRVPILSQPRAKKSPWWKRLIGRSEKPWGTFYIRPRLILDDGTSLSIQASEGHHSDPRSERGPWRYLEVDWSGEDIDEFDDYVRSGREEGVEEEFGHMQTWPIPVELIEQVFEQRGYQKLLTQYPAENPRKNPGDREEDFAGITVYSYMWRRIRPGLYVKLFGDQSMALVESNIDRMSDMDEREIELSGIKKKEWTLTYTVGYDVHRGDIVDDDFTSARQAKGHADDLLDWGQIENNPGRPKRKTRRARPRKRRRRRNPAGTPLREDFEELVGVSPADATMSQIRDYQDDERSRWPDWRTIQFRLWTNADRKAFTEIANDLIDLGFAIDYEYFPRSKIPAKKRPVWSKGIRGEEERVRWLRGQDREPEAVVVETLGRSETVGGVSQWLRREGDFVEAGDPILEVDTDTATIEVPAPLSGMLTKRLVEVDAAVSVGDVIAEILPDDPAQDHSRGEIMIQSRSLPVPMDRILTTWGRHADSPFDAWVDATEEYTGPVDANSAAEALLEHHGGTVPDEYGRLLLREGGDVGVWEEPGDT